MKKKRNSLGQFTRDSFNVTFEIPGILSIFRALILFFLLLPWIYFLFYKFKILEFFGEYMDSIFSFQLNDGAKTNGDKEKKNGGFF